MALEAEDKTEIANLIAEALKNHTTPAPTPTPAPSDDAPVTLKDIKELLTQSNATQQKDVMEEVFNQRKEQLFAETPGFQKFFDEGTDWDDTPFKTKFESITDLKEKANMLKKLQANYASASQPTPATPDGSTPRSPEEEKSDEKMDTLTDKFHKGEIDRNQYADSFWKDFDDLLEA